MLLLKYYMYLITIMSNKIPFITADVSIVAEVCTATSLVPRIILV
jgi:hypothetical protein